MLPSDSLLDAHERLLLGLRMDDDKCAWDGPSLAHKLHVPSHLGEDPVRAKGW